MTHELQLPAVIRVLGQEFAVHVVGRDDAFDRGDTGHSVGRTNLNLQWMKVRGPEELSAHQAVDTLLHEVLHAIVHLFHLEVYIDGDGDEDLVAALTPALLHTLRDNPLLVDAIMSNNLGQPRSGEAIAHGHED